MERFTALYAIGVPLDGSNIDTDQIIPARFLAKDRRQQAEGLFYDARRDVDSALKPDFPLNQRAFAKASIVVAGPNFGCGSSREHAVTALVDNGFRVFVAPSFGDIFFNNCFQNAALPIRLPEGRVDELRAALRSSPGARMIVDLESQTVTGPDGKVDEFEIDAFRKECLLRGIDEISLTLEYATEIAAIEKRKSA
jgi:3-isopropylmalate/(R)-2-methylmalate dehydratase small subunit